MYHISKRFEFSASHQLLGLPPEHQCSRLHGHNYTVEIILQASELNGVGFIVDYGDLAPLKSYIDKHLDHRHLNDILPFQTSAENIAKHLFDLCKELWPHTIEIRVSETPKTWASYREK